jgi:hypothetical protein
MSMTTRAGDYLAMRRSLGYKLRGEGRMLAGFAARLDEEGQATITISAALAWAAESREAAPAHWRRRLSVVRGFARYLATLDPACQIPPADPVPGAVAPAASVYLLRRGDRGAHPRRRDHRRAPASGHHAGADPSDRGQRDAGGRGPRPRPQRRGP